MVTKTKTRDQIRRKLLIKQKVMGITLIALTVLIFYLASTGVSVGDRDVSAALLTGPMGLGLLLSNKVIIC